MSSTSAQSRPSLGYFGGYIHSPNVPPPLRPPSHLTSRCDLPPRPNMTAHPPPIRAQTLKQAKASYKSRSRSFISETEKKTIERQLGLERRAWRLKEAEKRKAEAARKRAEKEKKEKEEAVAGCLGTQRRMDRFGYKSSQMHLGAFLRKGKAEAGLEKENVGIGPGVGVKVGDGVGEDDFGDCEVDDDFGDLDVDEEAFLECLDGAADMRTAAPFTVQTSARATMPTKSRCWNSVGGLQTQDIITHQPPEESFEAFFDELGSSTQIARELDADEHSRHYAPPVPHTLEYVDLLDEDEFDLSVEDLEELSTIPSVSTPVLADQKRVEEDRKLMPPPPLPFKPIAPAQCTRSAQPSPGSTRAAFTPNIDLGLTLSQLEQFVDDDLELSQPDPG